MFVKPATGLIVRDPVSKVPLPATGANVPDTDMYWQRRLRDGDVFVATEQNAETAPVLPIVNAAAKADATA